MKSFAIHFGEKIEKQSEHVHLNRLLIIELIFYALILVGAILRHFITKCNIS